MLRTLPWIAVAALWALWSLAVWALHALGFWALSSAGGLPGGATEASPLSLPAWLAPWLGPEIAAWVGQLLHTLAPVIEGLLHTAPMLAGAWTVAAWLLWGIGSLLLVLLGGGLHLLIGVVRRSAAPARPPHGPVPQALRPERLQPPAGQR